ncbi:hypothetical protein BHU72_12495 [Desulfuribacillus stibiiarsenatis]|uniref:Prepilin leader peptidase/N-methyltransferase n=1 Tax=Desulfuribacillus stibiiarsenatis TaxID=1390249 RepID=A0A1E5L283_9FIRM|nr:A24 family peptidase [Desulfuribacillus stibiiarsenatis]OEH84216.1 hypothetical protein BHU72_12495 [Desulfuribacillus stibiiarsenatis]
MLEHIYTIIIFSYVFIIGAVIGSFLNVVIYRLPNEQSVIKPGSHCPNCKQTLKWYQLIPIFSYMLQRAKCPNCKIKISVQYPLIEALIGLLYILIYMIFGFTPLTLVYWILVPCFVAITIIDIRHYIIPDEINLLICITGIISSIAGITLPITDAILGSIFGGGILWILAFASRGGMGGGDIKFAFAIGLFTGWKLMFLMLFIASLLGLLYAVLLSFAKGFKRRRQIPFGPFLVAGAMIVLVWGNTILDYYFSLFL